ncbi:hypothetical protein [Polaribacter sp. SA4-12]|uniref:hypothetical protein n=1 Tax=Polaribacter sp. SA4-12 TaxID=1312072 RepID=UPI000B3C34F0|nr:hypothetical protein [Polaribacter sp. SA4-12]ARV14039.1 hypothetical protein BTO07_02245 [Polaribacter sp. SA4-12]
MNDQNFIQFKKKRDLGTMLSDAFKFLSVEWKPFFYTIFKTAIIPVLIAICIMIYYLISSTQVFGGIAETANVDNVFDFNFSELILPVFGFIFSYLIAYALISVSALSYIKSYISNNGVVNFEEVSALTKDKFGAYVGLFILNGIIVFFGLLFCFLPGIYLGIVLSLSMCLLIFQNKGVMDSIGDSFNFIKGHWLETFGILLVVQIIIGIIGFFVDFPVSLYSGGSLGSDLLGEDPNELFNIYKDPIYLILLIISNLIKFVLYIVTLVVTVFIYYDIKEQKNPSTDVINEIGVS